MTEENYTVAIPENLVLMPHNPECLGCGPDNPAGLHMRVRRIGAEFVTELTFDPRQAGGPGLAHGGALATACDDLLGFAIFSVGEPAVTRSLQVQYHTPVLLGLPYRLSARLDRRDGRKLFLSAEGVAPDGVVAFSATALFIVVDFGHFERFGPLPANSRLGALRAAQDARTSLT